MIRVDCANASGGFVVSMRPLNYEGPETYCDATGHCMTGKVILNTNRDSMTGLGSINSKFIATLAKF